MCTVARLAAEPRAAKKRVPGFGHQGFRGVDPRGESPKTIAQEQGIRGEVNDRYAGIHWAFQVAANKPGLVTNDVAMLATIMVQMGFSPAEMCGLALLSTMPGPIAHISEETQSGGRNRLVPDSHVEYVQPRRDLGPDLDTAGWN